MSQIEFYPKASNKSQTGDILDCTTYQVATEVISGNKRKTGVRFSLVSFNNLFYIVAHQPYSRGIALAEPTKRILDIPKNLKLDDVKERHVILDTEPLDTLLNKFIERLKKES